MPWKPLPRIAFAICTYPYVPSANTDLPLQIGDELYIIEQGGHNGAWYRGYLVAPPSLLAGLTSSRGQALEARVFSGVFPKACVEVREMLGDVQDLVQNYDDGLAVQTALDPPIGTDSTQQAVTTEPSFVDLPQPAPRDDGSRPSAPVPMLKIGDESVLAKNEPLVDEIASCLREWHSTYLHEMLLSCEYRTLDELSHLIERLDTARRQLLHNLLTQHELANLRNGAIWDLVKGNKLTSGDIIVRNPVKKGKIMTSEDSPIQLSQLQTSMSLLEDSPAVQTDTKSTHHVLVELKDISRGVTKPTTYILALYSKAPGQKAKLLSEAYAVEAFDKYKDGPAYFDSRARCLFTDLTLLDLESNATIYLAIKTQSTESPSSSTPSVKLNASSSSSENTSNLPVLNGTWRAAAFRNPRMSVLFNPKAKSDSTSEEFSDPSQSVDGKENSTEDAASFKTAEAPSQRPVKRISSIAVVEIGSTLTSMEEVRRTSYFRAPTLVASSQSDQEALHDDVVAEVFQDMRGSSYKFSTVNRLEVKVHPFSHPDSRALISETPTLLQSINYVERIGFPGAPTRPRSDIFLTLAKPSLPRGALLSHPRSGTAPLGSEIGMANLQLTLEVRSASGDRIENCIYPSANGAGHTAWRTPAVGRGESWNYTIRLAIRPEQVPGSHIIMSLADGFEFPFALCWVPLWNDDAFIADGAHSLVLYKYDEYTSSMMAGRGAYLSLPWSSKTKDESVTGPSAALNIETTLCSTKYSSNPNLLGLLKWREHRSNELQAVLKNFPFVPEIEVIKLLDETLDSLFEILVEHSGRDELEDLCFFDLVVVLGIVSDKRYNLDSQIDDYVNNKFRHPFAFSCLVRSFARLLEDPKNHDNSRKLREASKVGGHVFKFIITAKQQQITKEVGIGIMTQGSSIAKDLMPIFRALEVLMRDTSPVLIGSKTVIVQNYHTWLPPLTIALRPAELLALANNFIESCTDATGRLLIYKLILLNNISTLNIWSSNTTKSTWHEKVQQWLAPHWGKKTYPSTQWRDQVRICCSVAATLITAKESTGTSWLPKLLESYQSVRDTPSERSEKYSPLFPTTYPIPVRSTKSHDHHDEALIEIAALIAVCSQSATPMFAGLSQFELAETVKTCLEAYLSVLKCDAFPSHWLSLHVFHHKSALQALRQILTVLQTRFLPPPEDVDHFEPEIWRLYITTLISIVGSDAIALESFSEQKRRAVWKVGGDIRESGAVLLESSWELLGWDASAAHKKRFGLSKMSGYQVSYVPSLVGPVLQLCLSVHDNLRSAAVSILHSMIVGEGTLNENLEALKAEMIDSLEQQFKSRSISDGMAQKLFVDELADRMKQMGLQRSDPLYPHIKNLLQTLDQLLDLLIAVHSSESNNEASHIIDTLHLLEFFKDMRKEGMYVSYLHQLADLQYRSGNLTEAALALKMHADMFDWNDTKWLPATTKPLHPKQSAAERKESIYFAMIGYLEDGGAWHDALSAYQELANYYRYTTYDFAKLARTQRAMAAIHERISKSEVQTPRYFKVVFEGLGFPVSLRDHQFIYETSASDRLATFTDRLLSQFPSAQVVQGGSNADYEGQYLSIYPVSPQKNLSHPIASRTRISQSVKNHYLLAYPNQFTTTSRRQATKGGIHEQVMEKIVYATADTFPTILRRSEIISQDTVRVPPIQIGIERAMRKTQEIISLEDDAKQDTTRDLSRLTEALRLLVSPESSGNVVGYWDLLPISMRQKDDVEQADGGALEEKTNEDDAQLQRVLKATLIDHTATIRDALNLYLRPAHSSVGADLKKQFETSFEPILSTMDILPLPEPPVLQHEGVIASPLGANPMTGHPEDFSANATSTLQNGGRGISPHKVTESQATVGLISPTPANDRTISKLSAFSRFGDDENDAAPPAIGASSQKAAGRQSSSQSLQDRFGSVRGSVSKRLSSIQKVGRHGIKGGFKGPTVESVAER